MKYLFLIILLGGAVLVGLVWWNHRHRPEPVLLRQIRTDVAQPQVGWPKPPERPSSINTDRAMLWAAIESKTLVQFIANLREIGCPEQTIQDIITFQVCRSYRRRILELEISAVHSWDYTRFPDPFEQERRRWQAEDLRNARDKELETLLGVSNTKLKSRLVGWQILDYDYNFLSLEKQAQLRDLNERYRQLTKEAKQGLPSEEADPTVDARLKELNRQKQAELAKLLTPQELEALNLHESPAARYVLNHLPEAKSEEEFRKMVRVVEEVGIEVPPPADLNRRYGLPSAQDTSDADRKRAQKQEQLAARLKEVLGEQRTAEQQQEEQARQAEERKREALQQEQQDRAQFLAMAESVGISEDNANRFFDRVKEMQPIWGPKFNELEKSLTGTPAEKHQQMQAAIKAEMDKLATETLGVQGPELIKKMMEKGH